MAFVVFAATAADRIDVLNPASRRAENFFPLIEGLASECELDHSISKRAPIPRYWSRTSRTIGRVLSFRPYHLEDHNQHDSRDDPECALATHLVLPQTLCEPNSHRRKVTQVPEDASTGFSHRLRFKLTGARSGEDRSAYWRLPAL